MKIKGIFFLLISGLLAALILVYLTFQSGNGNRYERTENSTSVIRILASYEMKSEQELLNSIAEQYERQCDGVDVQFQWIDRENLKKEVCLSVDAGKQLDLVICSNREVTGLMDIEVLQEVPEALADQEFRETLLYPELWKEFSDEGKYYGIPFTLDPYVLFCNTVYFERKQSAYPQTWEELLDICEKTGETGISGLGFGVKRTGDAADLFDAILYTFDGNYYALDSEGGKNTLELLDILKKRGCINKNVVNCTPTDAAYEFAERKMLMLLAPLSIRGCLETKMESTEFRIYPIPEGVKTGHAVTGNAIGILKTAGTQASDFLQFLFEENNRREIIEKTGTLPLYLSEAEISLSDDVQILDDIFREKGSVPGSNSNWFEVSSILAAYQYNILVKRNVNADSLLSGLQDDVRVAIMR